MAESCTSTITLSLGVLSTSLLIISELLGLQDDKGKKCTSVLQMTVAGGMWWWRKVKRCFQCSTPPPAEAQDAYTDDDLRSIADTVSQTFTLRGLARPLWHAQSTHNLTPPAEHLEVTPQHRSVGPTNAALPQPPPPIQRKWHAHPGTPDDVSEMV